MAIVSVAIVLSFHLKSEPKPLGKTINQACAFVIQSAYLCCRETIRTAARNHLLVTGYGMYAIRTVELHQYRVTVQSTTSNCADRMEDANCVHHSIRRHCWYMYLIHRYKRRKVVDASGREIECLVNGIPRMTHTLRYPL